MSVLVGHFNHLERFHDLDAATIDDLVHADLAIAQQAIGRVVVHRAFMPVVGLVADPDPLHRPGHMLTVAGPGQRHVLDQTAELALACAGAGLGKALQQALIGHADDAGVDCMVAVIVAVLFAVQPQDAVEPELCAQHRGHLARNHPRALRTDQAQVFACHPAQVPGVIERPSQKALVVAQPAGIAFRAEAVALVARHQFGTLQHAFGRPSVCLEILPGFPGCAVALDAVGLAHGDGLVVEAVVQCHREGQDMLDLDLFGKQHAQADLHAAVGTAPVGIVVAEFLPEDQLLDIACLDALRGCIEDRGNVGTHALVAFLVPGLALLFLASLFPALLEIACHFDDHLAGVAVAFDQLVDDGPDLVETDVNRGVGYSAKALLGRIVRIAGAEADMALQVFAVVGQLLQYFASGGMVKLTVVVETGCPHGLVVGHDFALQCRQDAFQGLHAQAAVALRQGRVGDVFCAHLVNTGVYLQPLDQPGFVFLV